MPKKRKAKAAARLRKLKARASSAARRASSKAHLAISSSGCPKFLPNSVMSAPTMNTSLALVTSRPLTPAAFCRAPAASRSSPSVRASNLLIASSLRSKHSSAIPPACCVTRMDCPWNMESYLLFLKRNRVARRATRRRERAAMIAARVALRKGGNRGVTGRARWSFFDLAGTRPYTGPTMELTGSEGTP